MPGLNWLMRLLCMVTLAGSAVASSHAPVGQAMLEVEATSKTNAMEGLDELVATSMNRALSRASVGGCRAVNQACWVDAQCCSARCHPSIRRCRPVR